MYVNTWLNCKFPCPNKEVESAHVIINSKFFISGDVEQSDKFKNKTHSGLYDAIEKFRNDNDISVFEFTDDKDIVRNKLISKILKKYEEWELELN
jgi:phosphate starvation-inducible protein PhoH